MTSLIPQPTATSRRKFHSLTVDMTPMVDLGFLLITFFIFTATLSQPRITRLILPQKGESMPLAASKTLTFLLDKEKVYAYEGSWEEALAYNRLRETNFSLENGMGNIVRKKQALLAQKEDLAVLLKPLQQATYQQVIAALDEMQINVVKKYALVAASASEEAFVQKQ